MAAICAKILALELWGGEFWSDGEYIGTVGEATSEKTIKNYIRNQSSDKKKNRNQDEATQIV